MSYEGVEDKRYLLIPLVGEICRAAEGCQSHSVARVQTASSRGGAPWVRLCVTRFESGLVGGSPIGVFGFSGDLIGGFFDGRSFFFAGFAVAEVSVKSFCSMVKTITYER